MVEILVIDASSIVLPQPTVFLAREEGREGSGGSSSQCRRTYRHVQPEAVASDCRR